MTLFNKLREFLTEVRALKYEIREAKLLTGTLLSQNIRQAKSIREAEFKVFSQWGDDGIIQYLINSIDVTSNSFIEFGVETYEEANTRFLLINNNWRGLVIDGSQANINFVKNDSIYWRHDLTAVNSFITVDNINQIIEDNGYNGKVGILSIDIDGNDYWIWEAIKTVDADIVIVEYNSLFGDERAITVPYKSDFDRSTEHYSALYFGASLTALCHLGAEKGYSFVGCNLAGNNAYFVKKDKLGTLQVFSPKEGYVKARFREARNENGELTYANENLRKNKIIGLPVINVITKEHEII